MAANSLVSTKLYFPPLRSNLVPRPRLIQQLESGLRGPFTLVSAPAGYGKTTLLSEWRAGPGREIPVAWVSLDAGDNDLTRFLTYLTAALDTVQARLAANTAGTLQAPQLPPLETILTILIGELADYPDNLVLILDDWHVITEARIQEALGFLLTHLPPQIHLAVLTRADPPVPLARLRAGSRMTEIRASQLRFRQDEAAAFFRQVMGLDLTEDAVGMLEARSEGWIAGLQLAALSMQGRDTAGLQEFITAFAGSHHYIVDYLAEEVLAQQPLPIRDFLVKTSILDRMCAPLCDELLKDKGEGSEIKDKGERIKDKESSSFIPYPSSFILSSSSFILERLESSNLFLIPLDDERCWYRYHHLFRDLLHSHLIKSYPDEVAALHRRASQWFAGEGDLETAISHAFLAHDDAWTAGLIERASFDLDIQNKLVVIARWIDNLPAERVAPRPWLCVYRAWGAYWMGRRDQVEGLLQAAEKALDAAPPENILWQRARHGPDPVEESRANLQGHIAAIRAHAALTGENIPEVLKQGQKALALLSEGDEMRTETAVALGGAYWALGDVVKSEQAFSMARASALLCRQHTMAVPSCCYVGLQQTKQGRLNDAEASYRDGLRMATRPDGRETPVAGFPNIRLGDVLRERNLLVAAGEHLVRGVEQCIQLGQADVLTDGCVALARLQITLGELDTARETLHRADQVTAQTKVDPFVLCWLEACRLRLLEADQEPQALERWIKTCGLNLEGPFSYHYDLHHLNLAWALLQRGMRQPGGAPLAEALDLLERLSAAAEKAGWVHDQIKIQAYRALAFQALGRGEAAQAALAQALSLARPHGYVRVFVDEGEPMRFLLAGSALADQPALARYAQTLLTAFSGPAHPEPHASPNSVPADRTAAGRPSSVPAARDGAYPLSAAQPQPAGSSAGEFLTQRELELLRCVAAGMTNQEIARKLVITIGTVKRHTVNIFRKLDVPNRTRAVARARELGLL